MDNTINISLSIQISNAVIIACITIGTSYIQKLSIDSYMSLILLINEFIIEFVFGQKKLNVKSRFDIMIIIYPSFPIIKSE